MCSKTRYLGRIAVPGEFFNINTRDGIVTAHFGFEPKSGVMQYNSRVENLSVKARRKSGILEVEGFFEKDYFFHMPENKPMKIAVTWHETSTNIEFSIITRAARPPVIGIHSRMPLLISDEKRWLEEGFISSELTFEREKQVA